MYQKKIKCNFIDKRIFAVTVITTKEGSLQDILCSYSFLNPDNSVFAILLNRIRFCLTSKSSKYITIIGMDMLRHGHA